MNIMLERKLLSSVQELIYSFNRKKSLCISFLKLL